MKTDLVEIFQTIRANLQPYTANGFTAHLNTDTAFDIWGEKEIDIKDKKKDVVCFASLKIEEEHVVFCLMPIAEEPKLQALINTNLLKLLKDNSCFYFTQLDDEMITQIADALAAGFTIYKQKGWV